MPEATPFQVLVVDDHPLMRRGIRQLIGAYAIVGLGANYQMTKNLRLNAGISNLFDKQIYRENDGASTYNEPGRAYYAGVTMSF